MHRPRADTIRLAASVSLHGSALMLVILLLAAGPRFHLLDAQSLWNDEGNAYVQATRSLSEIPVHAARDIHPPGYYWLLAVWHVFTGDSEFALRSLSVFASVLTVAVTFALGKRLYAAWVGLLAASIVALNTFSIFYAQEARMYALLALWGALGMWTFVNLLTLPRPSAGLPQVRVDRTVNPHGAGWALALGLINAAGLWTHYAYPLVMLTQGILLLAWVIGWRGAAVSRRIAATIYFTFANIIALILFAPWVETALRQLTTWGQSAPPVTFAEALSTILGWLTFGITHTETTVGALAVGWLLLLFGLRRGGDGWALLVPVTWVGMSVGLFLAAGLFRMANLKFLLPAQVGMALWLSRGVWVLWTLRLPAHSRRLGLPRHIRAAIPKLAGVAAALLIGLNLIDGLDPLYHEPQYQRPDYRAIVAEIESALQPGDAVILNAPNQAEVFNYYYRADAPVYPLPTGLGGDDAATRSAVESIIESHDRAFAVFWGEAERDPQRIVETTLDAATYEVSDEWYGDVRLVQYVMPAALGETVAYGVRFGDHITLASYAVGDKLLTVGEVLQLRLDWQTDAPLESRYKVFVQLLDENGTLAAQRDSEPGGGVALTTTWTPDTIISDRHGLQIPKHLPTAHYTLIIGLYDVGDPQVRLPVGDGDYLVLTSIIVDNPSGE